MENKRRKTFTLLEMIIIFIVAAFLAAMVVVRLVELSDISRRISEESNIYFINSGLKVYFADSHLQGRTPIYPVSLDNAIDGTYSSENNPFFDKVLRDSGVKQSGWHKIDANNYIGLVGESYTYDNINGEFYK